MAGLRHRPETDDSAITEPTPVEAPAVEAPVADRPVAEPVAVQPVSVEAPARPSPRPKPAGKRRDTGVVDSAVPAVEDKPKRPVTRKTDPVAEPDPGPAGESAEEPAEEPADEPVKASTQPRLTLPLVLVVAALLLAGAAFWFAIKNNEARVALPNTALTDAPATSQLVGEVNQAVGAVLSYRFDDLDKSMATARSYLIGDAVGQYERSMAGLVEEIKKTQLKVTVKPVSVGVVSLTGDDARVLVYADQIGSRADNQPAGGPAQFAVDMHRVDGKWKIVKLDFFDGK